MAVLVLCKRFLVALHVIRFYRRLRRLQIWKIFASSWAEEMRTSGNAAGRVYRFFNLSCLVENFPSDAKVEESCTFDSDSCVNIAGKVATHSPSQSRSRTDKPGLEFSKARLQVALSRFLQHGTSWDTLGVVPEEARWVKLLRDLPEQFQHFSVLDKSVLQNLSHGFLESSLDESSCVCAVVKSVQFVCAWHWQHCTVHKKCPSHFLACFQCLDKSSVSVDSYAELFFPCLAWFSFD